MIAEKNKILLSIKNLNKSFPLKGGFFSRQRGTITAVDDVSFQLYQNSSLGIVGESGSGKTTLGKCILRLIEPTSGSILFEEVDLCKIKDTDLRMKRRDMQMIFQDPYSSLDPRMTVEQTIGEALSIHKLARGTGRKDRIAQLLTQVGISPEQMKRYPHQFSSGQRQRIGIARALALNPKLLIADEPVSALDVSIQAQVINLMMQLKEEYNLTYIIISHDLAVVKHMCYITAVMYLGRIVEIAPSDILYESPAHPYSESLLAAIPVPDPDIKIKRIVRGEIPNPDNPPPGCHFHPRCTKKIDKCSHSVPKLEKLDENHYIACHMRGNL